MNCTAVPRHSLRPPALPQRPIDCPHIPLRPRPPTVRPLAPSHPPRCCASARSRACRQTIVSVFMRVFARSPTLAHPPEHASTRARSFTRPHLRQPWVTHNGYGHVCQLIALMSSKQKKQNTHAGRDKVHSLASCTPFGNAADATSTPHQTSPPTASARCMGHADLH